MAARRVFTFDQLSAIEEHKLYHKRMHDYLLKKERGEFCSLPEKPKKSIAFLEGGKKKKSLLSINELHHFLLGLCVTENEKEINDITESDITNFNNCSSIEEITPFLIAGVRLLRACHAKTIHHALIVGHFLEKTRDVFNMSVRAETWPSFLKNEINISPSHAQKLTKLSNQFYLYPKFHNLNISINELYSKWKIIRKYMDEDQRFRDNWQN